MVGHIQKLKQGFISLLDESQLVVISQFVVWLDEKIAEFKVNGYMRLDNGPDQTPRWIHEYSTSVRVNEEETAAKVDCEDNCPDSSWSPVTAGVIKVDPDDNAIPQIAEDSVGIQHIIPEPAELGDLPPDAILEMSDVTEDVDEPNVEEPELCDEASDAAATALPQSEEIEHDAQLLTEVKELHLEEASACEPGIDDESDITAIGTDDIPDMPDAEQVARTTPRLKHVIQNLQICLGDDGNFFVVNEPVTIPTGADLVDCSLNDTIDNEDNFNNSGPSFESVSQDSTKKRLFKKYLCGFCQKAFDTPYKLRRHVGSHTGIKPYHCPICEKSFVVEEYLKNHMRYHATEKNFACSICGKMFIAKASVTNHMRYHRDVRPYSCQHCSKSFILKSQMKAHMKAHNRPATFECDVCHKKVTTKSNLSAHMRIHTGVRDFVCSECGKSFSHKVALQRHIQFIHSDEAKAKRLTLMNSADRPHHCPVCGIGFKTKFAVKKHMCNHSADRPYKCDKCERSFIRPDHLRGHQKTHNSHTKDYMCSNCGKFFATMTSLRYHAKKHVLPKTEVSEELLFSSDTITDTNL